MTDADGFGLIPLEGGFSGETFLGEAAGERSVVRVYSGPRSVRRGPEAPAVDAAVLRLVRGLLPVAEVLEMRRPDPSVGAPGLLVTSFLPGTRLDLLLPGLGSAGRRTVGRVVGGLLGRLASMPCARAGTFRSADLDVESFPPGDLVAFVDSLRVGTAIEAWSPAAYDGLLRVAARASDLLDPVTRTCLVHSDVNPKNLLVDPETLEVTGLLDWEFAHAGLPVTDLGNVLRFERDPDLTAAVLAGYRSGVPDAPADDATLLDRARAADLLALVDLAARRGENTVTDRAHDRLRVIASTGDLHAVRSGP